MLLVPLVAAEVVLVVAEVVVVLPGAGVLASHYQPHRVGASCWAALPEMHTQEKFDSVK